MVCALSVDNRILTVFKEEKNGQREEMENVEVKLMAAGMYVFGVHSSAHDYVTDELWAALFKMLLEERLVPNIVLSSESPGFDWITKFVQAGKWYKMDSQNALARVFKNISSAEFLSFVYYISVTSSQLKVF